MSITVKNERLERLLNGLRHNEEYCFINNDVDLYLYYCGFEYVSNQHSNYVDDGLIINIFASIENESDVEMEVAFCVDDNKSYVVRTYEQKNNITKELLCESILKSIREIENKIKGDK